MKSSALITGILFIILNIKSCDVRSYFSALIISAVSLSTEIP